MSESLQTETRAYYEQAASLASKYPAGYYALFVGALCLGAYPSYREALDQGYEKAQTASFLVKQITCMEEVQRIVTPVVTLS